MKKKKNKIVRRKITTEKDVMLDKNGLEDIYSFKGTAFNRPVAMTGFIMIFVGPLLGGMTDNSALAIILFILGGIIFTYASSKKI